MVDVWRMDLVDVKSEHIKSDEEGNTEGHEDDENAVESGCERETVFVKADPEFEEEDAFTKADPGEVRLAVTEKVAPLTSPSLPEEEEMIVEPEHIQFEDEDSGDTKDAVDSGSLKETVLVKAESECLEDDGAASDDKGRLTIAEGTITFPPLADEEMSIRQCVPRIWYHDGPFKELHAPYDRELMKRLQNAERVRRWRRTRQAKETPEEAALRRAQHAKEVRQWRRFRRANETPEEAALRRAQHAEEMRQWREFQRTAEPPGEAASCLTRRTGSARRHQHSQRARETPEAAARRRARHAESVRRWRQLKKASETPKQAALRRAQQAAQVRRSRAARRSLMRNTDTYMCMCTVDR